MKRNDGGIVWVCSMGKEKNSEYKLRNIPEGNLYV